SLLAPIPHPNGEARRARISRSFRPLLPRRRGLGLLHWRRPRILLGAFFAQLQQRTVATMTRAWRGAPIRTRFISPQRTGSVLKSRLPQTDAQPGASDLQRPNGHADQLGNFLSALASLHQIFDLQYSLWRKLNRPATNQDLGGKRRDLSHFCTLCAFFCPSCDDCELASGALIVELGKFHPPVRELPVLVPMAATHALTMRFR